MKCLNYDGDPSEQLPVVIPFLADGGRIWAEGRPNQGV